jgi:hypothetical protein
MTTEKWPPISPGTSVKTTRENPAVNDWLPGVTELRQWGVLGKVTMHHDSHGLYYGVEHPDGSIGCYDPSELEVI